MLRLRKFSYLYLMFREKVGQALVNIPSVRGWDRLGRELTAGAGGL